MKEGIRIATILIAILIFALGPTSVSGQNQRYYSQSGFSIIPPEGWITNETQSGAVKFPHPTDDDVGFGIISRTSMLTLEQGVANIKGGNQEVLDEYQLVSEGNRMINDILGYELVFTCRFENESMKTKEVFLSHYYGQVYEILFIITGDTYNDTYSKYSEHLPTFEASLATFEMYDPEGEVEPNATAIVGGETYSSREEGFSITGPSGWQMVTEGVFDVSVQFVGPMVGSLTAINMAVKKDEEGIGGMDLEDYVRASLPGLITVMDAEIVYQTDITIGRVDAREVVYTSSFFKNMTGFDSKQKAIILVKGRTAYVISFGATPELYDEYVDEFDASVATFKPIGRGIPNWLLGALLVGIGLAIGVGIMVAWRRRDSRHATV